VASDPRSESDTEDVPDALAVFHAEPRGPDAFKWSGYFSFRVWTRPKPTQDWNRQQAGRLQAFTASFPAQCDAAPRWAEGSHRAQSDT
jgi:hypothetical protein